MTGSEGNYQVSIGGMMENGESHFKIEYQNEEDKGVMQCDGEFTNHHTVKGMFIIEEDGGEFEFLMHTQAAVPVVS